MRGQKDAREWPHIGRGEKKVASHLRREQSPPCHRCTNALRLFLDKYPGVVYISMPH